ncbi:hypothetical protein ACFE33_07795 [Falsihalocynthiibacter sp. SS001]|uniref:hypothetical protein n=1 Tax=Falsihalocynthiibacter sp. SS001 TaxID=3349698 RepID=UPI0036D2A830
MTQTLCDLKNLMFILSQISDWEAFPPIPLSEISRALKLKSLTDRLLCEQPNPRENEAHDVTFF